MKTRLVITTLICLIAQTSSATEGWRVANTTFDNLTTKSTLTDSSYAYSPDGTDPFGSGGFKTWGRLHHQNHFRGSPRVNILYDGQLYINFDFYLTFKLNGLFQIRVVFDDLSVEVVNVYYSKKGGPSRLYFENCETMTAKIKKYNSVRIELNVHLHSSTDPIPKDPTFELIYFTFDLKGSPDAIGRVSKWKEELK